jgi:predicted chitinase
MEYFEWGILVVRRMFPEAYAQANVTNNFPLVERALNKRLFGIDMKLYAYATIRAESAGFTPLKELESRFNTLRIPRELVPWGEAETYNRYEWRKKLGNEVLGDGQKYMGRGFIQITGRANYILYGTLIGKKLVDHPEVANDPEVAAEIVAAYLFLNRARIQKALDSDDLAAARKVVNGGTHGLAEFSKAYKLGRALLSPADRRITHNTA